MIFGSKLCASFRCLPLGWLLLFGCAAPPPATAPEEAKTSGALAPNPDASAVLENQVQVAPDESLEPTMYVERGLPPLGKNWSPEHYQTAAEVLSSLSSRTQLPRKHSPTSQVVFSQLVSTNNLESLSAQDEPVAARLETAQRYLNSIAPLLALYHQPIADGRGFPAEKVELVGLIFKLMSHARSLAREQLEGSTGQARTAEARRFTAVSTLGAGFVQGAVSMLASSNQYPKSEQQKLATLVSDLAPALWPDLTPAVRERLKTQLAETIQKTTQPDIRASLTRLDEQLPLSSATDPSLQK